MDRVFKACDEERGKKMGGNITKIHGGGMKR